MVDRFGGIGMAVVRNVLRLCGLGIVLLSQTVGWGQEEDFSTSMMRATVKLQHDRSTATGFIVTRPSPADASQTQFILVTANHVLESTPGDETTIVFRVREADGTYKKSPAKLIIRAEGKPRWTKHPTDDVAAIVVTPPNPVDLPSVPMDLLATDDAIEKMQIHPGDTLSYAGYPHRVEANEAGFPLLRNGAIASYPLLPTAKNHVLLLGANSFEGDSGSPVFMAATARVIEGKGTEKVRMIMGLVSAQQFIDEELKTLYGTTKMRHRLGLALVVQAPLLRETIEKLPQ